MIINAEDYIEVSAKTKENIDLLFQRAVQVALNPTKTKRHRDILRKCPIV